MLRTALWRGALFEEAGEGGGAGGTGGSGTGGSQGAGDPPGPGGDGGDGAGGGDGGGNTGGDGGAPFATFKTQEQFDDRMKRATRKELREAFGTDNVDEIRAWKQRADELATQEEERKREAMSEQERLQADLNKSKAELQAIQEERDAIRFEAHVKGICAELGIKNVDYAMYAVNRAADGVADGSQLDAKEHLSELLDASSSRAALGVAPKSQVVDDPANTSPEGGGGAPPPKPPGSDGNNIVDATKMTREEFQAHLASKGIGLLGN
jgi:hypothetical protein